WWRCHTRPTARPCPHPPRPETCAARGPTPACDHHAVLCCLCPTTGTPHMLLWSTAAATPFDCETREQVISNPDGSDGRTVCACRRHVPVDQCVEVRRVNWGRCSTVARSCPTIRGSQRSVARRSGCHARGAGRQIVVEPDHPREPASRDLERAIGPGEVRGWQRGWRCLGDRRSNGEVLPSSWTQGARGTRAVSGWDTLPCHRSPA